MPARRRRPPPATSAPASQAPASSAAAATSRASAGHPGLWGDRPRRHAESAGESPSASSAEAATREPCADAEAEGAAKPTTTTSARPSAPHARVPYAPSARAESATPMRHRPCRGRRAGPEATDRPRRDGMLRPAAARGSTENEPCPGDRKPAGDDQPELDPRERQLHPVRGRSFPDGGGRVRPGRRRRPRTTSSSLSSAPSSSRRSSSPPSWSTRRSPSPPSSSSRLSPARHGRRGLLGHDVAVLLLPRRGEHGRSRETGDESGEQADGILFPWCGHRRPARGPTRRPKVETREAMFGERPGSAASIMRPRRPGSRRARADRRAGPPRCGSRRRACGRCSSGGT